MCSYSLINLRNNNNRVIPARKTSKNRCPDRVHGVRTHKCIRGVCRRRNTRCVYYKWARCTACRCCGLRRAVERGPWSRRACAAADGGLADGCGGQVAIIWCYLYTTEYCVNAAAACTCAAHVDSPPQWRDMRPWDADTRIASRPARGQRRLRRRRRRTARTSWARGAAAGSRAVAMMRR